MVNLKLLQQMILTALFLVLTSSCATPPPTLDRVATSVAEAKTRVAEDKAIAATLTAEVPTATLTPSATATPTFTPTTLLPTETPTIISSPAFAYIAEMSVHLNQPIVLANDKVRVTVMEVNNIGDRVGGGGPISREITVKQEYQESHYLLELKLTVANLTNIEWAFGTLIPSMAIRQENGAMLVLAGACDSSLSCSSGWKYWRIFTDRPTEMSFIFAAPNELNNFTLYLLDLVPWTES